MEYSNNRINWNGIIITEKAAIQIYKLMKQNPSSQGLVLNIKKSGCAGFNYNIKLIDKPETNFLIFKKMNAKLFVPINIMPLIDGTEIDYIYKGLNQLFQFKNPKAQYTCGCGESFGI